jgi:hypothetical protein
MYLRIHLVMRNRIRASSRESVAQLQGSIIIFAKQADCGGT